MRTTTVAFALLALLALNAVVEAKRLDKFRAASALRVAANADTEDDAELVEAIDVDAQQHLPFDDDYWTAGNRGDISKIVAGAKRGKGLATAALLKKFFSADNILLAQQQGQSVKATIATYKAAAMTRGCNQGVCDDNWAPLDLEAATGTKTQGGQGTVTLTCSVPKDLTTAKCTLDAWIAGGSTYMFSCPDVGGAGKTCTVPTYQYQSPSSSGWYTSRFVTDSQDGLDVYFNNDVLVLNWKWHGTTSGRLVFTALAVFTSPFSAYKITANPAMPGALPQLSQAAKKAQVDTAGLMKKFFTAENIELAQQQGVTVTTNIGGYSSAAITRSCNQGVCSTWNKLDLLQTTGTKTQGGDGTVTLTCTVPKDLATAKCTLDAWIAGGSTYMFSCPDVGGAGKTCTVPTYQYQSPSSSGWYTSRFVTDVVDVFNIFLTGDAAVFHWTWHGVSSGALVGTDLTVYTTSPFTSYKPNVAPAAPVPLPELVKAKKATQLTTAQLLEKFFTKDNIQLAQMQGTNIPVKATIASYKAVANSRTCNQGICSVWSAIDLMSQTGTKTQGGEGSVTLTCTVPKDLTQAKCTLDAWIAGGATYMFSCPDVGGAGKTCTVPTYQYQSPSSSGWYTSRFTTDVVEVFNVFFTNSELVINWKWHGVSSGRLVTTELTVASATPLSDFASAPKANCISKTTTAKVMELANTKLKNKITLTEAAVDLLIKGAPYKDTPTAIDKVKGIGPKNVVYVNFFWNLEC